MAPSENFHRTLRFLSVLLSLSYINCYINCMHQNCVLYQNLEKGISLWFLQVDTGSHMRQFLSIHYIYKQLKMTAFFLLQCDQRSCFFSKLLKKYTRHFVKYKYSLQKIAPLFSDWNWKIYISLYIFWKTFTFFKHKKWQNEKTWPT